MKISVEILKEHQDFKHVDALISIDDQPVETARIHLERRLEADLVNLSHFMIIDAMENDQTNTIAGINDKLRSIQIPVSE